MLEIDWPEVVSGIFKTILSGYELEEGHRNPQSIAFTNNKVLMSFAYDRQNIHVILSPLPTEENDDPDYVDITALFAFLGLIDATDTLFQGVDSAPRMQEDLKRCAELLPRIEAYVSGRITDYDPIWERIENGTLFT